MEAKRWLASGRGAAGRVPRAHFPSSTAFPQKPRTLQTFPQTGPSTQLHELQWAGLPQPGSIRPGFDPDAQATFRNFWGPGFLCLGSCPGGRGAVACALRAEW